MTTEVIETAFEIVPAEAGLEPAAKLSIESAFSGFFQQAAEWKEKAETITDPKEARAGRLAMAKIRNAAEKTRVDRKAQFLRMGKAIDGANNIYLAFAMPIEERFENIEKEEERRIAAERIARATERLEAVRPYVEEGFPIPPLGDLSEIQFTEYLAGAKLLHETKAAAIAKAEADRIEREAKDAAERAEREAKEAAERETQRLENIRLKAEAEAREKAIRAEREAAEKLRKEEEAKATAALEAERAEWAKIEVAAKIERDKAEAARLAAEETARKERAAIEAKAKAEAEAREKAEREAKALRDAETKRLAEIESARIAKEKADVDAAKKAAAAPDKARLIGFASIVRAMTVPEAKSADGKRIAAEIGEKVASFASWIEAQAAKL